LGQYDPFLGNRRDWPENFNSAASVLEWYDKHRA